MLTLAIDTVTDRGSVALGMGADVLGVRTFTDRTHAAALLPAAAGLLSEAGRRFDEVRRIVVANGPGSFTGIRIGFATAFGIRRSHPAVELVTIPSLSAAAWAAGRVRPGVVAALYDALRGEVFAAVYRISDDSFERLAGPELTPLADLAGRYRGVDSYTGEVAVLEEPEVRDRESGTVASGQSMATAVALLDLARRGVEITVLGSEGTFEPDYGRPAEAQVRWEREHGHGLPGY